MRRAAAIVLLAAAVQAQGLADWLPDDVLFHVGTRDLGRLKARAREGPLGALWSDPALRLLTRRIEARFRPARPGDVGALDLLALVDGEVLVAGVPDGDGYAMLGLVDAGPRTLPFRSLLDLYCAQQARGRRIVETDEQCDGHTIHVRRLGRSVQAHAWLGSVVCFSDSVPALRALIARHGERGIAPPTEADLCARVDPSFWLRRWGLDERTRAALGLDRIGALVGEMTLLGDGVRTRLSVELTGPARGVVRLLRPAVPDLGPAPLLPADTGAALTIAIDWAELARLAQALQPGLHTEATLLARAGIDLSSVVRALGDRVTIAFLPPAWARGAGTETVPDLTAPWGDLVIVLDVDRPKAITRLLERIDALAGPLPGTVYLGTPIRVLPGQNLGVVALVENRLVLGARLDAVRAVIRAGRRGGVDRPAAYRLAAAHVPRERSLFAFLDPHGRSGPALVWTLVRNELGRDERGRVMDAFEKYRDVSSFSLSRSDEDLVLTWFVGVRR